MTKLLQSDWLGGVQLFHLHVIINYFENNSSSCLTGISKHSKTMYENTCALRSYFHTLFSCVWIPGETLALVVHILHKYSN